MSRLYQDFNIKFHQQTIKKNVISTPFKLVFGTQSRAIEKYCIKEYPSLMKYSQYSLDQLKNLQLMKTYIKNKLATNRVEKAYIHEFFYERRWMDPLKRNNDITYIELTDYDCKLWTDPEVPFLEVKGIIYFDIDKMLKFYFKKKYIRMKKDSKIIKLILDLRFSKNFPLLLTYRMGATIKKEILTLITNYINDRRTNKFKTGVEKFIKLKKIETFKKNFRWKSTDTIEMEINDTAKLLKIKASESSILPLVGGYVMYKAIRRGRRR